MVTFYALDHVVPSGSVLGPVGYFLINTKQLGEYWRKHNILLS